MGGCVSRGRKTRGRGKTRSASNTCNGCAKALDENGRCGSKSCSVHHWRSQSRGGTDRKDNLGRMLDKPVHRHIHTLFGSDRLSEVVGKILINWDTICPHKEIKEKNTKKDKLQLRMNSWNELFGDAADNQKKALEFILTEFIVNASKSDKELTIEVLRKGVMCKEITQKEYDYYISILN